MTTDPASSPTTTAATQSSLDQVDLSAMEFWEGPRDVRAAAALLLRDAPDRHSNSINGIKQLDCAWD